MGRQAKDSIKFREGGVEAPIPDSLYRAIIRIQVEKGLSWEEACEKVADLADHGSAKFKKEVKEEARRLHKSELMRQLNKARSTIERNALARGMSYAHLRYPCSVCGKDMVWDLRDEEKKNQLLEILRKGGIDNWCHNSCRTPTS